MSGVILDQDGDVLTRFHFDATENKSIIETVQDVEPYLEANLRKANDSPDNWKGSMHHVASIPLALAEQWFRELGDDPFHPRNKKWLNRRLNDSEFNKTRTKRGRI